MTAKEVLAELEKLATEQNRRVMARHGTADKILGVSYAQIGMLAKRIKTDHQLALELWKTAVIEARLLACEIIDPSQVDEALLDKWVGEVQGQLDADPLGRHVAARSPVGKICALKWIKDKREIVQRCGWSTLSVLLKLNADLTPKEITALLALIEKQIHKAPNDAREAMNWALIALGTYREDLRDDVLAAAERIGPVAIDHGETNCRTPFAPDYIRKAAQHNAKKAASVSKLIPTRTHHR